MKDVPAQLRWSELGAAITGKLVAIPQPEESSVEGRVIAVEPDALRLETENTGEIAIPRASITALEVRQNTKIGRILGTVLGVIVGLPVVYILVPIFFQPGGSFFMWRPRKVV
jgi:RNase P/RNase MRP subunit p29